MKKIRYSKDVDALLVELSQEPIAYAEEEGQVILHYSPDDKALRVVKSWARSMLPPGNLPTF